MDSKNHGESFIEREICQANFCYGCGACRNICPRNCIDMRPDDYGEIHPHINKEKCISCGMCNKVCPRNSVVEKNKAASCFAGWRINSERRRNSSSGGVAALIAEWYIKNGGIVFGTVFERTEGAHMTACKHMDEIEELKGSKYVQSDIGLCCREIEDILKSEKNVVCFGTPCQIAAIKSYLKIKKINTSGKLLLVDFLCHGAVPNEYLLKELSRIEERIHMSADALSFRSNDPSRNYFLCLYNGGEIIYKIKAEKNPYFLGFLNSITTRNSCLNCDFKCVERVGDITLGDFIGLGGKTAFNPGIDSWKNPSLILVNTNMGEKALSFLHSDLALWERSLDEAIDGGPSLQGNIKPRKYREQFRILYKKYGYTRAITFSTRKPMRFEYIKMIKKDFKQRAKRTIKDMFGMKI